MNNLRELALLTLIGFFPNLIYAQDVYKTVDEEGKVIFSDKPAQDSEKVEVEIKNIQPPLQTHTNAAKKSSAQEGPVRYSIALAAPAQGQRYGPAERRLTISAAVSPALKAGHYLEFYLSGRKVGGPGKSAKASVPLNIKMRGQKTASAKIVDTSGRVIASSGSATVYILPR